MCADSQSLDVSHFSIGGIHGFPYKQWQGSGGTTQNPNARWGGYCTHGTVLFPTWHRPYLAIYEVHRALPHKKATSNHFTLLAANSPTARQGHCESIHEQNQVNQR